MKDDLLESASQTAGPYVHIGCTPKLIGVERNREDLGSSMIVGAVDSRPIRLEGIIYDGLGAPVKDAIIELWQADSRGLFNSPDDRRGVADEGFKGWGRKAAHPETGEFRFDTIKPGRVPGFDGRLQAPHISVWIAARGINLGLCTRIYFEDEVEANSEDPVLARIQPPERVQTLLARRVTESDYRFEVRLQGPQETVFFEI